MATHIANRTDLRPVTVHDAERLLARAIGLWAAVGFILAACTSVLVDTLWVLALGLWIGYVLAGAVLVLLAVLHVRSASSPAVGVALAVGVPVVVAALWYSVGFLRSVGIALALWLRAI